MNITVVWRNRCPDLTTSSRKNTDKSSMYEPSSFKLLKMWMCVPTPVHQLLYCTLLYFSRRKMFIFCVCFLCSYYLCEKYYKPIIVKYYIVDCVSWVPRRPLLDLWTNWNYKENGLTNALLEPNSFVCRGFTVIAKNCGIYITETRAIFSCVGGGRNYSSTRCLDYWWEC